MSTLDITLSADKAVVFPPRCVVCEAKNPDGFIKLSFLGIKTTPLMTIAVDKALDLNVDPKYYDSNTSNEIDGIPACKGCSSSLKWYHRLLKVGYYTAWLPGMVPILLGFSIYFSVPFMILCACSPGVFTLMYPPSFGASFYDGKANFEFKSQAVAEEFLQLNSDATLKKKEVKAEVNQVNS